MRYLFFLVIFCTSFKSHSQDSIPLTKNYGFFNITHSYGIGYFTSFKPFEQNVYGSENIKMNQFGYHFNVGFGYNHNYLFTAIQLRTNYLNSSTDSPALKMELLQFDIALKAGYNIAKQFMGATVEPFAEFGVNFSNLKMSHSDSISYLDSQSIPQNTTTKFENGIVPYLSLGIKHTFPISTCCRNLIYVEYQYKLNPIKYKWSNENLPLGADIPFFRSNAILLSIGFRHYLNY